MKREDYTKLLQVAEGIIYLDDASRILSGCGLDEGKGALVFRLWEVLRSNAAERFRVSDDMDRDIENYHNFSKIIEDREMTIEEKYDKLMK